MLFAKTWLDLEIIMLSAMSLSAMSQTEKNTYHMISFIWEIFKNKNSQIQIGGWQRQEVGS